MKKTFFFSIVYFFAFTTLLAAQDIVGFWKSVDEKTGKPQSIVAIYKYQGKYYGRLIATLDDNGKIDETLASPKTRAPAVKGNPYYVGLDFIWDLEPKGDKFADGHILDPEEGKIYDAEMWKKGEDLIVRGEIWFFGRNQTWPPALDTDFQGFQKPNLTTMVPKIPDVD
jgi:uncharacterized protein (DUF2147 family)